MPLELTDSQISILKWSNIISCIISLICCIIVILSWIIFKPLRVFAYNLIFCLFIAVFIRTLFRIFAVGPAQTGDAICTLEAFMATFGGLSQFLWVSTIAIIMWTIVFHRIKWNITPETRKKRFILLIIINYAIPLIFSFFPFITKSYGNIGGWCWILGDSFMDHFWRWALFYIWCVLSVILCIFIYAKIGIYLKYDNNQKHDNDIESEKKELNEEHKFSSSDTKEDETNDDEEEKNESSTLYSKIKFYPLALIIGYGIPSINRFIDILPGISAPFPMLLIQSITAGLFGFIIFIIYGNAPMVIQLLKECLGCSNQNVTDGATGVAGADSESDTFENESENKNKDVTSNINSDDL